ncbi:uncharacterized protein LOC135501081 isoform X2 [Lineus longissimus]|uniref:uncharacterized protein LOC135501081 isoform X2 n=1 Tax=Lineus longissimus TaxID=88925 RepID=UPI00315DCC7C
MRSLILIVLVIACVASLVSPKGIQQRNVKRFLGLPSLSDIKARIGSTIGTIEDKIIDTLYAGGDIAYNLGEAILTNERITPYAEKIRTILYELKEVASASEHEWQKLRERLLADIKELFDRIMEKEKVQFVLNKVEGLIDEVREAAKSSKEKAKEIGNTLTAFFLGTIFTIFGPTFDSTIEPPIIH